MRKSMMMGGLALVLAAATAGAQPPRDQQRAERPAAGDSTWHGRRGPGGPEHFLLRGITLTDAQKQQLESLRKQHEGQGPSAEGRKAFEEIRALREKGDTAQARAKFQQLRAQMEKQREQQFAAIRGVLTADQRKQFDANVAEMKQRQAQRGDRAFGGARRGDATRRDGGAA